jgi:predicted metalloprotease with PDZ domain
LSTNTPIATPRIPTPTVTRVLAPTRLPANTAVPSASLGAVGIPASPRATGPRYSDQVNKANAHIYRYRAHQRDVEVYVEQEGVLTQAEERERADYCFEIWTRAWEIFGGYAFPIYECIISDRLGDPGRGSSGITYWSRYGASFLTKPGWQDLMAHEIFHAWNYGHLPFEELWIVEGMAQYYNYLLVDPNRALQWVKDNAAISVPEWIKKGIDGPLVNIQRSSSNEPLAYYKGALVWYMLDLEISERTAGTKSLNNVLRRLYLQYGTQGILPGPRPPAPPRQAIYDAVIAEAGSREFFASFFKDYIEGARDLREWHNGLFANSRLVYLPPHATIK